jgi:hypothetical protein
MGGRNETHPLGHWRPLFFSVSVAAARPETCSIRAQNCVTTWGGPRPACYEAFRLAACEKTGKYIAPNGDVWPATRADRKSPGQG